MGKYLQCLYNNNERDIDVLILQTGNDNEEWGEKTMKNVQDVEEQAVNSSANFWFTAGGLYVEHCL